MITIKNAKTIDGETVNHVVPSSEQTTIDAQGLTLLPALIDPHVHFRVPGAEHKENWSTGARAAIFGGISTVFDMPNNNPSIKTRAQLREKKRQIDEQLRAAEIPLNYHLYLGADKEHLDEIELSKDEIIGVKVFMGSSTGSLLMDDDESLRRVFELAARHDLLVAVHAEDECIIQENQKKFSHIHTPQVHSQIRDCRSALVATQKAIQLSERYGTRLYILHMSTAQETRAVRDAKARGLPVFAECTPHHLFLNTAAYDEWGVKVQVNPPLRESEDQQELWRGLNDGTIDSIGTDHAPHTLDDKNLPYGSAPSGIPSLEFLLPLLLTAYHQGRITLERIVETTRLNIEKNYRLPPGSDIVLVDLDGKYKLPDGVLKTKCAWSPYAEMELQGRPIYTIVNGKVFYVARDA